MAVSKRLAEISSSLAHAALSNPHRAEVNFGTARQKYALTYVMDHDPARMARHRAIISGMLASSLKQVFVPEPTDRFDALIRALDEVDRDR